MDFSMLGGYTMHGDGSPRGGRQMAHVRMRVASGSKGRDGGSSEPFFDGEFCQAICVIIAFVVALLGLIFYLLWRVRSTGAGETATGPIHALLQLAKVIFPDEPDGDGEGIPYPVGGAYEEHARREFEQYERAALKDEA